MSLNRVKDLMIRLAQVGEINRENRYKSLRGRREREIRFDKFQKKVTRRNKNKGSQYVRILKQTPDENESDE